MCCVHNGESKDLRNRGGLILGVNQGLTYNCFNCGFKTGWSPGNRLSKKFIDLLTWFNMPRDDIQKLAFMAYRLRDQDATTYQPIKQYLNFPEAPLPIGAKSFVYWLEQKELDPRFLKVLQYVCDRGKDVVTSYDFYWSPTHYSDRVILPFKWNNVIVGYTARAIYKAKQRYINVCAPNYLFNTDSITDDQKYIILCEGPFDALAISGVATLGNHLSAAQIEWLNNTRKTIVVLPDREKRGGLLVDVALANKWFVSFPRWDPHIKDASEAVNQHGKLYSLWALLTFKYDSPLSINMRRKSYR